MAAGGGDCPAEVLEGVRELLRGQGRLEQLVADLARGGREVSAAAEVDGDVPGPASSLAEGQAAVGQADQPQAAPVGFVSGEESINSPLEKVALEQWLENAEVREELVNFGDSDQLIEECRRGSALLRGQSSVRQQSGGTQMLVRHKSVLTLGSSRTAWLSSFSRHAVMSPASSVRAWLDVASLFVLGYNLSATPYFLAFQIDPSEHPWLTLECMSALFWSLDILTGFRTGYYEHGHLRMDPRNIAIRYARGTLILDIVTLSVDILTLILHAWKIESSGAGPASFIRIIKIVRVLRLSAMARMRNISSVLEQLGYSHTLIAKLMSGSLFNVCQFLLLLLWINHAVACFWLSIGRQGEPHEPASDTGYTWMDLQTSGLVGTYGSYGRGYLYATAFHWSLTQMTPGSMQVFPVNTTERVFSIFVLMFGLLVFSVLVSGISANAAQLRIDVQVYRGKMEVLGKFLNKYHLHPELRMQVCKQVKDKLAEVRPKVVKDLAVLDMLSLSLRHTLQLELCNPQFLEHPLLHFISSFDIAMWEETCMTCAHFSVLGKGDNLFVFGAEAQGMYFVVRGCLSYALSDSFPEELARDASPGDQLSEAALWCRWRHMGFAEAQEAACCEVLLLQASTLMPILTRRGLTGQLPCAYARSFHHFLQHSKPPLSEWPNDLVLPFGADEVIAAMQKDAAVIMGKWAVEVLMARPRMALASWLGAVNEDNIEKLVAEVREGRSTLLVTGKANVVRCVPLVVLRIRRWDGRVFVRMRFASKADGGQEATCKLPGGKQEAGEHPDGCLQRLLGGKLGALRDGIVMVGVKRQRERENSAVFGVPTRYIRTVVSAEWPQRAARDLEQFLVLGVQPHRSVASRLSWWRASTEGSSPRSRRSSQGSQFNASEPVDVVMFPGDRDFYAWLTEPQLAFLSSPQGQPNLSLWLSDLYKIIDTNSDRGSLVSSRESCVMPGQSDGSREGPI